jgi:deoxyribodipyrimidine photolyase-related protein
MSNEAKGPWCEIWDGLFWTFIGDHAEFFQSNPRLSMMASTWTKLAPAKQETHRKSAETFLATL